MNWKQLDKHISFSISDEGQLRNDKTGRILKPTIGKTGYWVVTIRPDGRKGKSYSLKLHRLVAKAFIPNLENKPQINHKDGNKLNNHYSNLEWVTPKENVHHAISIGLMNEQNHLHGEAMDNVKLNADDVRFIRKHFIANHSEFGYNGLSKLFNVHRATIRDIVVRKRWKHLN